MMENRQTSCSNAYRTNVSANNMGASNRTTVLSSSPKPSRKNLMDRINQYSFAVNEANLFLDTHPYDTEALAYFQKYRKLRLEAVEEYADLYAPLIIDHTVSDRTPWSWANEPWPWEGVEC